MTSLIPREPYSTDEISRLYPSELQLQLVQILLRHGERTPVSARFRNAGLEPYWPYCNAAKKMSSVAMTSSDSSSWSELQWRRRIETFGDDDDPVIATGKNGEVDGVCQFGELTDKGRQTTLELGQRLRHLYVDQLKFMPRLIADADMFYLRATPIPRALESVQQTFWGMYPLTARTAAFPPPTILTRTPGDETLFPNDSNCRRFNHLSRAFAQRTADRWNSSTEMAYINRLISSWMPEASQNVAVDSHPRLSGINDTINSTLAHGPATRLPAVFYDPQLRKYVDRISTEEWFSGYKESVEYRSLGIGALVGDIVSKIMASVERTGLDSILEIDRKDEQKGRERGGEKCIKFTLSGCHDTTLASILSSLGAFENEPWPPYTSHIAIELFRQKSHASSISTLNPPAGMKGGQGTSFLGNISSPFYHRHERKSIARRPLSELTPAERAQLDGYYVRLRYNDRVITIPGCRKNGNHVEGDESFCTLVGFH
ncbi:MAG: hypothetical protein M1834_000172 [Cirrosporium novae-zelandiae]|nr:MAG: hypothetical protein M1834_000172 [Cirrosporium novae-zelandiae]